MLLIIRICMAKMSFFGLHWAMKRRNGQITSSYFVQEDDNMWIRFRNTIEPPPSLSLGNNVIERITSFKLLGICHQNNIKWTRHIEEITKRASKRLYHLRECRQAKLHNEVGITCYLIKIRSLLEYGVPIWGGLRTISS